MNTLLLMMLATVLQTAAVDGRITKAGTTEGLAKATVELRSVPDDKVLYAATSADGGRFAFSNVKPGQYRVAVSLPGFVPTEYGKKKLSARGTVVDVAVGQRIGDLQMALTPTGAIRGRVIDNAGHPVVKAEVQAMKVSYQDGRRVFTPTQSAVTDDLGEYRLFYLAPGIHYVAAIGPQWPNGNAVEIIIAPGEKATGLAAYGGGGTGGYNPLAAASLPDDRSPGGAPERFETVFFPNTTDDQKAQPVEVEAGGEAHADLMFTSYVLTRHVRITLADDTNGPSPTQYRITSVPAVAGARVNQRPEASGVYPFDISTAPTILSVNAPFSGPIPVGQPQVPLRLGRVSIPAGDQDLDVRVNMKAGMTLQGKVIVEGGGEPNAPKPSDLRVQVVTEPLGLVLPFSPLRVENSVAADGTFKIPYLFEGSYHIGVSPLVQRAYVQSIHFGEADALNGVLQLPGGPDSVVNVVIANNAGSLTGTIVNDKQEADGDSTVVLVPANRNRGDLYRSAIADASGKFKLDRIPPGDYKIFAFDEVEPGAWQDPIFMQRFEERGAPIHIDENSSKDVRVIVIR